MNRRNFISGTRCSVRVLSWYFKMEQQDMFCFILFGCFFFSQPHRRIERLCFTAAPTSNEVLTEQKCKWRLRLFGFPSEHTEKELRRRCCRFTFRVESGVGKTKRWNRLHGQHGGRSGRPPTSLRFKCTEHVRPPRRDAAGRDVQSERGAD